MTFTLMLVFAHTTLRQRNTNRQSASRCLSTTTLRVLLLGSGARICPLRGTFKSPPPVVLLSHSMSLGCQHRTVQLHISRCIPTRTSLSNGAYNQPYHTPTFTTGSLFFRFWRTTLLARRFFRFPELEIKATASRMPWLRVTLGFDYMDFLMSVTGAENVFVFILHRRGIVSNSDLL